MLMFMKKIIKNIRTFGSYEHNDELFSDRNVFPKVVLLKWKGY
jgi:hypothetical protein